MTPTKATASSVAGKANHKPVIFPIYANINVIGMITTNPLNNEIIFAGPAWSVDVKYMDRIIFHPAKTQAEK